MNEKRAKMRNIKKNKQKIKKHWNRSAKRCQKLGKIANKITKNFENGLKEIKKKMSRNFGKRAKKWRNIEKDGQKKFKNLKNGDFFL